jgi:sensor c-di-GMP phosphodiesterase-like protein
MWRCAQCDLMIADDYDFGQGYLFAKVLFQNDFLK